MELKAFYKDDVPYKEVNRHLDEADVERWTADLGCSRSQLFDEIAMRLATGYGTRELSFNLCDAVVNDLFGPVTNTEGDRPLLFWEVYLAFDEGEYYHGNKRDEDPEEVYTRPLIERCLEVRRPQD